mgnify:CR=1 FL=1
MEIMNKYGQVIKSGVFANDILKDHLSTQSLIEKRNLSFETREEFLQQLKKVLSKNSKLFNSIKKALEKNDLEVEKMRRKKDNLQEQNTRMQQSREDKCKQIALAKKTVSTLTQPVDELKRMEEERTSLVKNIAIIERTLATATSILNIRNKKFTDTQKVFNEAKQALEVAKVEQEDAQKDVENATLQLQNFNLSLSNIDQKIETEKKKRSIFLVSPGYTGEIPSFGTFVSTVDTINGISKVDKITPASDFKIKPDFEEMVDAGYDSAQEYAKILKFVELISQFIYNEKAYTLLVSDERIKNLIKLHIG